MPDSPHAARVVIAGGGVAALETLIALRALAGEKARPVLLTPAAEFVYRPLAVTEPFCLGRATRHPLAAIAADFDAELVPHALARVDVQGRRAIASGGVELAYDSLVVATGARAHRAYQHAITFGAEGAPEALAGLLADLEQGYARRVAFVVPEGVSWPLPLYELALLTARDAADAGMDAVELTLVTPEAAPLALFGQAPSRAVAMLLERAGIAFAGGAPATVGRGEVLTADQALAVDRVVSLPVPIGPRIAGLPSDLDGFVPVDGHGRVRGLDGVFAAGDVTDAPIKQGGLAAQQADAVAEAVAARHGVDIDPQPARPVLRGMLLTGADGQWLRGPVGDTPIPSRAAGHALWWPPTKIASRHLAPYLLGLEQAEALRVGA